MAQIRVSWARIAEPHIAVITTAAKAASQRPRQMQERRKQHRHHDHRQEQVGHLGLGAGRHRYRRLRKAPGRDHAAQESCARFRDAIGAELLVRVEVVVGLLRNFSPEAPQPSEKPTRATTAPPRNSVSQSEADIPPGTPGVGNPVGISGTRLMFGSKAATRMEAITTAVSAAGTLGVNLLMAKDQEDGANADRRRHEAPVGDLAQDVPELLEGVTGAGLGAGQAG